MREFYRLSSDEQAIVDRAASVAREVIAPRAEATDREARFPREQMDALGAAGLLGLTLPAAVGGLGQGPRVFAAVCETIAGSCGSTAMVYLMHVSAANVIAARPPQTAASLLKEIAAGKHMTTLAFSEKGSRGHFWAPVSKERREGGKLLVDAEKSWVTSAGQADSYVVSTQQEGAKAPNESSIYWVPRGRAGLSVSGGFDGLGLRGNASAPMRLAGVEVVEAERLSAPGGGFQVMLETVLPWFTLGSAANVVGLAEAALAATAGHLKGARFEHLGQSLAEALPNLRANVARMRSEIDRSRAQVAFTATAMEQPGDHTMPAVLSVKLQAAEMALEVTDLAMRSCGGAAFSRHLPIERQFRDARAAHVMSPTSDMLKEFLGRAALGLPVF